MKSNTQDWCGNDIAEAIKIRETYLKKLKRKKSSDRL